MRSLLAPLALSLATVSTSFADDVGQADLILSALDVITIDTVDDYFRIHLGFEITNIGTRSIDLGGIDPDDSGDNVGLQTYITSETEFAGLSFATGGAPSTHATSIPLAPGESYKGVYFANTNQLPDPFDLSGLNWMAVRLFVRDDTPEANTNNWAFAPLNVVPTPGSLAIALPAVALAARRRR